MDEKVGPFRDRLPLQGIAQEWRGDGRVEHDFHAQLVRLTADRRHVEHVSMRVAGGFKVDVDIPSLGQTVGILFLDPLRAGGKVLFQAPVERFHGDRQISRLRIPIMNQLISAAVDVAAGDEDIVAAQQVCQRGVDGGHATVKVPGQIIARVGTGFKIDDVIRQRNAGRVEQPRVDLQHEILAGEGVFDPLRTGVDIGRRPRDDGCRGKDGRNVVEDRVRTLGHLRRAGHFQGLIALPKRLLKIIEQFRQLEGHEFLGVEAGDAVGLVEFLQASQRGLPQLINIVLRLVHTGHQSPERPSKRRLRVDGKMGQLLSDEAIDVVSGRCISPWRKGPGGFERIGRIHERLRFG